ncbi:hypothetical protein CFC21_098987 [Triticum aestivum]|uniref:BZIP domain-containing protein n=2 Tax=Triticum aestivum TaxID=4565 RepID=A0A9R1LYA6_WHEAT|nr:hypothetical protein CFC21_098984 [Triticum aestivum]KAF7097133.1 hypothetical protein CFC21_098987 [Triticum aestivum]
MAMGLRKGQSLLTASAVHASGWALPFRARFKAAARSLFLLPSIHSTTPESERVAFCIHSNLRSSSRSTVICEFAAAPAMQQELAALAYQSAGFVGLPTSYLPPHPHDVDVDLVDGWLVGGSGGAGDNGRGPPSCGSGLSHVADAVSETRKARRLASNRESARRSRMRRRRQLDELSACAAELRAANQRLVVELNRAEARHAQVARDNARLREELRRLRGRLAAEEEAADRDAGDEAAAARTP